MILNVTDDGATTTGVTDLSILGIPPYVTPDEICVFVKIIDKGCRIPLIFWWPASNWTLDLEIHAQTSEWREVVLLQFVASVHHGKQQTVWLLMVWLFLIRYFIYNRKSVNLSDFSNFSFVKSYL